MNSKVGNGVIMVGDVPYAAGLFWQTAENAKSVRREAQLAAKQEASSPEFFVMREGAVPQWAIGWVAQGHRNKMSVAAACLSEAMAGNWIGVFAVGNRWWFIASRREAILPYGDVVFDYEDDCRIRCESELARGGWDRVFMPPSWGGSADNTPLEDLLSGNREPRLSYLQGLVTRLPTSAKVMIVAGVIGVAVAGYVGKSILESVSARERAEAEQKRVEMLKQLELERQQAEAERNRVANQKPLDLVDRAWEARPLPEVVLIACAEALSKITIEIPGWVMVGMSCADSGGAVSWQRDAGSGSIASARYILDARGGGIDATGNSAQLTQGFEGVVQRGAQKAWKMFEIRQRIVQMFQDMQEPVNLELEPRPPRPEKENPLEPRPRPPANLKVQYNSVLPPMAWAGIWSAYPGFVMESISFTIGQKNWSYQGRIYEDLTDEELNAPESLEYYRKNPAGAAPPVQQNAKGGPS